ncbi:MAG: S8 family peptidase [Prevotellaceae bacterium]|nr:S8 family peptidase [Prevotellaceae bacterium]
MKQILALALCGAILLPACAQTGAGTGKRKWDAQIELLLKAAEADTSAFVMAAGKSNTAVRTTGILIDCSDPQAVADDIRSHGYRAEVLGSRAVKAVLPVTHIRTLGECQDVHFIHTPRKFRPLLSDARADTKADKLHTGTELETPFTGKDVVVGVIDQGFEYRHIAFTDAEGRSRVVSMLNHSNYDPDFGDNVQPTTEIPDGHDALPAGGHATHVTAIAAGSVVEGGNLQGFAPEADIIMVPSSLMDDGIIAEVKYIKETAEAAGRPWVVNMSFGQQLGPHDGSTLYDRTLNEYIKPGGLIVAAMGNEAQEKLHASHTFAKDGETVYLVFSAPDADYPYNIAGLWEQTADGKHHLTVKPVRTNATGSIFRELTATEMKSAIIYEDLGIDIETGKEYYLIQAIPSALQSTYPNFALSITGNKGDSFHAWCNVGQGSFLNSTRTDVVTGDNLYCVSEGGATIPKAIAVGAYTVTNRFKSLNGNTYEYPGLRSGDMASFSSYGPYLGKELKPSIAAPGGNIKSAFNRFDRTFSLIDETIVAKLEKNGRTDYYGVKNGTSMATPAVTGIIAMWLQACPTLTYEQIMQIFAETGRKFNGQGNNWHNWYGYGKIDAYEGLKRVLALTGIDDVELNSQQPVTICKEDRTWRILFNNNESDVTVSVYDMAGHLIFQQHADQPRAAEEIILPFDSYNAGAYIVRIRTPRQSISRKVIIK